MGTAIHEEHGGMDAAGSQFRYNHLHPFNGNCIGSPYVFVLVLTFKASNDLGPRYLKDHLLCYLPSHTLRSTGEPLQMVRSAKEVRLRAPDAGTSQ